MKRVNWLLIIIVMVVMLFALPWIYKPGWAYGAAPESCQDSIVITQAQITAGYTLSDDDTCACFESAKLSSASGTALTISGRNILLVLNRNSDRDTLAFGTDGGGSDTGLFIFTNPDVDSCITIKGGAIVHQSSDTTTSDNFAFVVSGATRLLLDDVNMKIMGYNGIGWKTPSSAWENRLVVIDGGEWESAVTSYTSRCNYDAIIFEYNEGGIDTTSDSGLIIDGLIVRGAPGPALQVAGDVEIKNCSLYVDSRNDFYSYPSGGVCLGNTNSAGIIAQLLDAGSSIHDNVIIAGDDWYGCDVGILIQVAQGELGNEVEVYDNEIYVHASHDKYYEYINAKGIKNRYGCDYLNIYDNYIEIEVATFDEADSGRGNMCAGLEVTSYAGGSDWPGAGGNEPDSNVHYLHNEVMIIPVDSNFNAAINFGLACFRMATSDSAGHTWTAGGNIFDGQICTTPEWSHRWGPFDHGGEVHDFVSLRDSIYYSDSVWVNSINMAHFAGYNGPCPDNIVRDAYYGGRAADSATANAILDFCDGCGDPGDRDVSFERTLSVTINDGDGSPIEGAIFTAVDDYDNTQITDTTGADGIASGVVRYWKEYEVATDSTTYNDFTFTAQRPAGKVRLSYMFQHYSVGLSALINNTDGPNAPRNILDVLDTTTITYQNDTARFVFRSYNINFDHQDSACGDTVSVERSGTQRIDYINSGYDYDWQGAVNRNRIMEGTSNYAPVLRYMWERDGKTDSVNNAGGTNFFQPFSGAHYIDYEGADSAWESYDMVIFKNPYVIWQDITSQDIDSTKLWYGRLRDSLVLYPNINVCLIMGSPLCYQADSDADFDSDTVLAKMVYDLATWFNSNDFFTHTTGGGAYDNLWKFDPYQLLCETDEVENRYCLKDSYWGGAAASSHLSGLGAEVLQDTILGFVRASALEILETTATTSGDYTVAWDRYDTTLVLGKVGTAEEGGTTRTRLRGFKP